MPLHRSYAVRAIRAVLVLALTVTASLAVLAVPAQALPDAPQGLTASGHLSRRCRGPGCRPPSATACRARRTRRSRATTWSSTQRPPTTATRPPACFAAGALYWQVQASTPPAAAVGPARDHHRAAQGPGRGTRVRPADGPPPRVTAGHQLGSPSPGPPATTSRWTPTTTASAAPSRTDIQTTTFVWPDPQGVGERDGTRGLLRPGPRQVRQRPAERLVRRTSYDVTQLPAVTSTSCATGLVCAPRPDRRAGPRQRHRPGRRLRLGPGQGRQAVRDLGRPGQDFNNQVEKRIVFSTRYSPAVDDVRQQQLLLEGPRHQRRRPADAVADDPERVPAPLARRRRSSTPRTALRTGGRTTSTTSGPPSSTRLATSSTSATTRTSPRAPTPPASPRSTTYTPGDRATTACRARAPRLLAGQRARPAPERHRRDLLRHRPGSADTSRAFVYAQLAADARPGRRCRSRPCAGSPARTPSSTVIRSRAPTARR